MLSSSVSSFPVDKFFHDYERVGYSGHGYEKSDIIGNDGKWKLNISHDDGDKRGDVSVDYGRRIYRSKYTSHCYY